MDQTKKSSLTFWSNDVMELGWTRVMRIMYKSVDNKNSKLATSRRHWKNHLENQRSGGELELKQVKSFNRARVVKQMSTLMLKYAIYAFSVEKQLKSVLNI